MADGLRPAYLLGGQWLLGKHPADIVTVTGPNGTFTTPAAYAPNAITATIGTGQQVTALLVSDIAAGGTGGAATRVVADQGSSGAQAWPVQFLTPQQVSAAITAGNVGISSAPVFSVSQSGAWTINAAITAGNVGISSAPVFSVSQSGAWTVNANITAGNVGISSAPAFNVNQSNKGSAGDSAWFVQGQAATTAAMTGNPFVAAGLVNTALPASAATGRPAMVMVDPQGRVIVRGHHPALRSQVTATGSTGTAGGTITVTLVGAPGAGSQIGICGIDVFNGDQNVHLWLLWAGTASSQTTNIVYKGYAAAFAGGQVARFDEPWTVAVNSQLNLAIVGSFATNDFALNLQHITYAT